jgi:hypothetical protein
MCNLLMALEGGGQRVGLGTDEEISCGKAASQRDAPSSVNSLTRHRPSSFSPPLPPQARGASRSPSKSSPEEAPRLPLPRLLLLTIAVLLNVHSSIPATSTLKTVWACALEKPASCKESHIWVGGGTQKGREGGMEEKRSEKASQVKRGVRMITSL